MGGNGEILLKIYICMYHFIWYMDYEVVSINNLLLLLLLLLLLFE